MVKSRRAFCVYGARMSERAEAKIIETALKRFKLCQEREAETRVRALEELKFSLGEQWDERVKRDRENDPDGARPCLTVDKCDQYVRQVVNDARQNKPSIKPRPKDDGADVETAEVLQGLCRHIEDQSSADIAYDTAVEMAARCGFGFIRVVTDYIDGDKTDQDIFIRSVANPFQVFIDPDCQQIDGSDAKFAFVFENVPKEQFDELYPDADQSEFERLSYDQHEWVTRDEVRIAEYWEVVETSINMLYLDDGSQQAEEDYWKQYAGLSPRPEILAARPLKKQKVVWRKITAANVLETRDWPSRYIGIVPTYGHVIDVAGKREIRGLIRSAMDPQRMYNYAASAFVERVSLSPKAPFIGTINQFEGFENEWAKANTSNQAYLPYNPDPDAPPPARQPGADVPAGWISVMQGMEHDIQSALGMYNASIGAPSNEKSGKAILARQREADVATFHIIDNLSRAIRQVGRILIDLIPKVYDTQRVIRILGEDGSEDFAQIDPALPVAKAKVRDEEGVKTIYNPSVGRYDVTVSVGPAYSTKRQEASEFLTQVVQSNPQMMQIAGDLMFKALDMPYAEEIAERMKKMLPPNLQDQEEGAPPPVPPEMQAQMQQMQEYIQQLEGALQQTKQQAEQLAADRQDAAIKADIDAKKLDIEAYKAETERMQAEHEAMLSMQQPMESPQDEAQESAALQAIAQRLDQLASVITQPAPPVPVQVFVEGGNAAKVKRSRAVKQEDGSWAMESIEEPCEPMPGGPVEPSY